MKYIDIRTNKTVEIIKEIDSTTVQVRRLKDNVTYKAPKDEIREVD